MLSFWRINQVNELLPNLLIGFLPISEELDLVRKQAIHQGVALLLRLLELLDRGPLLCASILALGAFLRRFDGSICLLDLGFHFLLLLQEVKVLLSLHVHEIIEVALCFLVGLHEDKVALLELEIVKELAAGEHALDVLKLGDAPIFWHLVGVLETLPGDDRAAAGQHLVDELVSGARGQP